MRFRNGGIWSPTYGITVFLDGKFNFYLIEAAILKVILLRYIHIVEIATSNCLFTYLFLCASSIR